MAGTTIATDASTSSLSGASVQPGKRAEVEAARIVRAHPIPAASIRAAPADRAARAPADARRSEARARFRTTVVQDGASGGYASLAWKRAAYVLGAIAAQDRALEGTVAELPLRAHECRLLFELLPREPATHDAHMRPVGTVRNRAHEPTT